MSLRHPSSDRVIFWRCFVFRLFNALVVRTAFAPDEFWQSTEVSHRLVFGYGHLTWEWAAGLRSYLHPLLFVPVYSTLKWSGIDTPYLIAKSPQLFQAVFAAGADLYVYKLALLLFGRQVAWWTLICQLSSWFNFYCLTRTYSSSIEATLTVYSIYWLIISANSQKVVKGRVDMEIVRWLLPAGLAVAFRPASGLFWAIGGFHYVITVRRKPKLRVVLHALAIARVCVMLMMSVDRLMYGRFVFVPWEFLKFNLFSGGSKLYGSHPWYWNFISGFPTMLLTFVPAFVLGVRHADRRYISNVVALYLITYSFAAHKEFRFLLPALQLAMPYCGLGLLYLNKKLAQRKEERKGAKKKSAGKSKPRKTEFSVITLLIFAVQVVAAIFFSMLHQRGQIEVPGILGKMATENPDLTVLFLTPCHATPYYSHIHQHVPLRFMDCSPADWRKEVQTLNQPDIDWLKLPSLCDSNMSERACFQKNPVKYLKAIWNLNKAKPVAIVGYASMMERLQGALQKNGYHEHIRLRNCLVQIDDDNECAISIWIVT